MRKFMSHKVVSAAKIVSAEKQEDGRWHFMREGNVHDTTTVEESPRFKITEEDLGYVVHYADGYISWSPTKAFEDGYIEDGSGPSRFAICEAIDLAKQMEADNNHLNAVYALEQLLAKTKPKTHNLKFGEAIAEMQSGKKVARAGWNGKGWWLVLVGGTPEMELTEGTVYHNAGLTSVSIDPHIDMMTAMGSMQPGWLASQADMLANDWYVVSSEGKSNDEIYRHPDGSIDDGYSFDIAPTT